MDDEEESTRELGEQIVDVVKESINPNLVTRSIHIQTRFGIVVTVTSQDDEEDIDKLRKVAEELTDKYIEK